MENKIQTEQPITLSHILNKNALKLFSKIKTKEFNIALMILMITILCKAMLVLFISTMHEHGLSKQWIDVFAHSWDSKHFLNIANNGYPNVENNRLYAFAPLYPYFVSFLNVVINDIKLSALITSNVFYFLSLLAFYKVASLYTSKQQSVLLTITFALFPTYLVYGSLAYSESMYLFFAIASFYYFKLRVFWLASILLTFAIFSRYVGAFLMPIYVIIATYWSIKESRKLIEWRLLWLLIPTLSYLALFYSFYLKTGDFFVANSSHVFFGDALKTIVHQIDFYFNGFFTVNNKINPFALLIERYMFVVPFFMLVLINFRNSFELGFYGLVFMLIVISMIGISSIASPRIMLASWVGILALRDQIKMQSFILLYVCLFMSSLWVMLKYQSTFFA